MLPRLSWYRVLALLLMLITINNRVVPPVQAQKPENDPVLEIISNMPPAMKVGQLTLVSFPGTSVGDESEIAELIRDYAIGGVILRPQNGNFGASPIASSAFISMTNQLQTLTWKSTRSVFLPPVSDPSFLYASSFLPLLVVTDSWSEGFPITSFISGTYMLPSPMAVGATWDVDLAESCGQVLGQDMASLGINLLLGPNLDVLYTPWPGEAFDPGTSVFGGSPFWVGKLGRAYVQGLQEGSEGRLLVAPIHFPGLGGADRVLAEEVPTVQRGLEQLRRIDLVPFFSVVGGRPGDETVVDALLVTHSRYLGLQSSISTRPLSLDSQALQQIIVSEEIAPWREGGGVLIADNLGLASVHRSYDPLGETFNTRRVVQEALVAGNDLLILDRFAAGQQGKGNSSAWTAEDWSTHFANIRDALDFVTQRYQSDQTFQVMVDDALYRVLKMKLRLYPGLTLESVQRELGTPMAMTSNQGQTVNMNVAMAGLTRIFPSSEDLLPALPQDGDSIVIFTQAPVLYMDAAAVPSEVSRSWLSQDAIAQLLLRFYGPEGTGLVRSGSVAWFSFDDLRMALSPFLMEVQGQRDGRETASAVTSTVPITLTPTPTALPTPIPTPSPPLLALQNADWIIFGITTWNTADPGLDLLKVFLASQVNVLNSHVVVFSFGPPYGLDSTEVSKLDLYYALYSPSQISAGVGIRALFRDLPAPGASPVDIPSLNYNLSYQLMPDPDQVISLDLVGAGGQSLNPDAEPNIRSGDVINLRTSVIVDNNGNPVPDNTSVQFTLSYPQDGIERNIFSETKDGVASVSVTLDRMGLLEIRVQSDPVPPRFLLQLTIRENEPVLITPVPPTSTPAPPTRTPLPATPTPEPERRMILPDPIHLPFPRRVYLLGWGMGGTVLVILLGFMWAREQAFGPVAATRLALWGGVGALLAYAFLIGVGHWLIPAWIYQLAGQEFLVGGVSFLGGVLIVLIAFIVERRSIRKRTNTEEVSLSS
jgi:beta-N-acetylhexosaminidase